MRRNRRRSTTSGTRRALWVLASFLCVGGCYALTDFDGLDDSPAGSTSSSSSAASTGSSSSSSSGSGGAGTGGGETGGGGTGGSPAGSGGIGGSFPCPPPGVDYSDLVLNEMTPDGDPLDWIELFNAGNTDIPLCDVFITQGYGGVTPPGGNDRYTFADVVIQAGGYIVIETTVDFPFGLAKDGMERITLFAPDEVVLDDTTWTATAATAFTDGESWARIPNSTGAFKRISSPTKGAANMDLGGSGGTGGI